MKYDHGTDDGSHRISGLKAGQQYSVTVKVRAEQEAIGDGLITAFFQHNVLWRF